MAKTEKKLTQKEIDDKIKELKIQLLNQKGKRKDIKKEIARLLTMANSMAKEKKK